MTRHPTGKGGPPGRFRWLLARLLPDRARDEALADLDELWAERMVRKGRRAANRWYRWQVVRSIGPAVQWQSPDGTGEGRGVMGRWDSIRRDLRNALVQIRRHPGVGVMVMLTIGLGIGATTAIFSVVHVVLLKDLPYEDPGALVMVTSRAGDSDLPRYVSGPDLLDMPTAVPALQDVAGFMESTVGPMTEVERPEHILTTPMTWNTFRLLSIEMALGRGFTEDDARRHWGGPDDLPPTAAVISHGFWERSFGRDPDVLGRVVHVWGGATEIVGVLPEGFRLVLPPELNIPPDGDIWRAIPWDMSQWSREWRGLRIVGRMAPGRSLQQVDSELSRFAGTLRDRFPHHGAERTDFEVGSLAAAAAAPLKGPLGLLMLAVTLVLLVASANAANLLLARGTARHQEMAVRSSLGARPYRLARQLLTESAVLAVGGVIVGVALALVGVEALHSIRPPDLPRLDAVGLDLPVLAFAAAMASVATILAGFLPSLQAARAQPAAQLNAPRGGIRGGRKARAVLVVGQVALTVTLLVGAGLLVRTFQELQTMPLGFDPDGVLTVTATQSNRPQEERQAYEAELLRVVREVPGVETAGIAFPLPMNGVYDRSAEYAVDGRETDPTSWTTAYFRTISPGYLETMGLELKSGRGFTSGDENREAPVVILDERLASGEFRGKAPLGERLWVRGMSGDTLEARVVGVVEYAPQWDHRDARPTMYFPRVLYQSHEVSVVVKSAGDPTGVAAAVSEAVRRVDPRFPADMAPMESFVRERLARSRFLLILMQTFGVLALGLSAVGLYGALSYTVRQQSKELGLRLALGAEAPDLTRRVVVSGLRLAGLGVAAGLVGAAALGKGLEAQLFRVSPADPTALIGAASVTLVVALVASLVPGIRAARISPLTALQED
ncbi:MAG: FtsX-like permease family protein [Gemmatimonadetes bacterium]|nr:FtsX-like permease family protein [Gemmatimonadota bacterium]